MLDKSLLLASYLADFEFAWSKTTLRNEHYRLRAVLSELDGDPKRLWSHLEKTGVGKYTRKTVWTRVVHFWDWMLEKGHVEGSNGYREFKRQYARLFKNVYKRTAPTIDFDSAMSAIGRLPDAATKRKAIELLTSGCRFQESFTYCDGIVTGKGGKQRAVYMPKVDGPAYDRGYHTFRNSLKKVGLKPHDLRKIWARKMAQNLNLWALCEAAGWESLETTRSYINNDQDMINKVKRAHGGRRDGQQTKSDGAHQG